MTREEAEAHIIECGFKGYTIDGHGQQWICQVKPSREETETGVEAFQPEIRKFLMALGSRDFTLEFNENLPDGIRWLAVLKDKTACVPVAGVHGARPSARGWSALDAYLKVRACLSPSEIPQD